MHDKLLYAFTHIEEMSVETNRKLKGQKYLNKDLKRKTESKNLKLCFSS